MIREDFLQQNAFVDIDSFSDYRRQAMMMQLILDYDSCAAPPSEKAPRWPNLFAIDARAGHRPGQERAGGRVRGGLCRSIVSRRWTQQIDEIAGEGG